MAIEIQCICGKSVFVELRDAGSARACTCGETIVIPSLSTLNRLAKQAVPPPKEGDGLYRTNSGLIIDPKTAVFPNRCIFTNEHVQSLSRMKLYAAEYRSLGIVGVLRTSAATIDIPVSDSWRKKQNQRGVRFGWWLKVLGLSGVICSLILPLVGGFEGDGLVVAVSAGLSISILPLIVGFAMPYLDDFNGSNVICGVRFLSDGRILIVGVDPRFVDDLPEINVSA